MNPRVDLTRRRHIDLAHVSSAFCCRWRGKGSSYPSP